MHISHDPRLRSMLALAGILAVVSVLDFGLAAGRTSNAPATGKLDSVELDSRIREAARLRIGPDNLAAFVGMRPTIDSRTEHGKIALEASGLQLDLETAELLAVSPYVLIWSIHANDYAPLVAGIAWDEKGRPHYFSAGIGY